MTFRNLFLLSLAFLFLFGSCTIEKRRYRTGYHVEWKKKPASQHEQQTAAQQDQYQPPTIEIPSVKTVEPELAFSEEELITVSNRDELAFSTDKISAAAVIANAQISEECETLVMTDGRRMVVKVLEINPSEVKYRRCNYADGPIVVVNKSTVHSVEYANGAVDLISNVHVAPQSPPAYQTARRLEVLGLISMIFGISGLFVFGLIFGAVAVILGIISLVKFTSRPEAYKGRGFMITGLILGFVCIVVMLLAISAGVV